MRFALTLLAVHLATGAVTAHAGSRPLDCTKKSLADAVRRLGPTKRTISFTGVCSGPITINVDGLTLVGVDTAVIDGGGSDAVTIEGASRVSLTTLEVRNGQNGIVVTRGAHVTLSGVSVHDNAATGIVVRSSSTAAGTEVSVTGNGGSGIVGDDGASITLVNTLMTGNDGKDLQLTFGSRADVRTSAFGTYSCDATVLARGTAGIVCPH